MTLPARLYVSSNEQRACQQRQDCITVAYWLLRKSGKQLIRAPIVLFIPIACNGSNWNLTDGIAAGKENAFESFIASWGLDECGLLSGESGP